jgi:hypothetical protein
MKNFERVDDGTFKITIGPVTATVKEHEDHIVADVSKDDPPEETRSLTFHATVQDGSLFLTRAESPMSIYPDDVLGDIFVAMIEMVD